MYIQVTGCHLELGRYRVPVPYGMHATPTWHIICILWMKYIFDPHTVSLTVCGLSIRALVLQKKWNINILSCKRKPDELLDHAPDSSHIRNQPQFRCTSDKLTNVAMLYTTACH